MLKYPRTKHVQGSRLQAGDEDLTQIPWTSVGQSYLVIEEKIDGANSGLSFSQSGELRLQSRGHYLTGGAREKHFALFKTWAAAHQHRLWTILGDRYIMFGEWVYARHSVFYRQLTHYFFEFDVYDKKDEAFLDLERRLNLLEGAGIETVPVVHTGSVKRSELEPLTGPSMFDSQFDNPTMKRTDNVMEGLYLRTEADGVVTGRAKFVRPEFVEKIKQSTHWQHQQMVPNELADGVDIWS